MSYHCTRNRSVSSPRDTSAWFGYLRSCEREGLSGYHDRRAVQASSGPGPDADGRVADLTCAPHKTRDGPCTARRRPTDRPADHAARRLRHQTEALHGSRARRTAAAVEAWPRSAGQTCPANCSVCARTLQSRAFQCDAGAARVRSIDRPNTRCRRGIATPCDTA